MVQNTVVDIIILYTYSASLTPERATKKLSNPEEMMVWRTFSVALQQWLSFPIFNLIRATLHLRLRTVYNRQQAQIVLDKSLSESLQSPARFQIALIQVARLRCKPEISSQTQHAVWGFQYKTMPENQASTSWKCYLMILEWGVNADLFVFLISPHLFWDLCQHPANICFENAKLDWVKIDLVLFYLVLERWSGIQSFSLCAQAIIENFYCIP